MFVETMLSAAVSCGHSVFVKHLLNAPNISVIGGGLVLAAQIRLPRRFNVASHFIDRHLDQGRVDLTAIECGNEKITYGDLFRNVNRTGNCLKRLGVEMENRVLMVLLDSPEFAYTFFAAIKIGAVPVPVNTLLKPPDYAFLLNDTRAKVLVVTASLLPQVEPVLSTAPHLQHVIVVQDVDDDSRPRDAFVFSDIISSESDELTPADTSKDDVAFWLYTSGTTGSPSAAVHLHHDMVVCAELYAKPILGISESDSTFSVAKLFFAYGLGNSLYFPLAVGATTVLSSRRADPLTISTVLSSHRPTIFFGVPTSYAALLQYADEGGELDMSSVRLATSAGEPLPAAVYRRFLERTGVEILDGIGTTEVLHIFISNRRGDVRPGSTGRPVRGYDVKLVDDEDRPVGPGETGNLMVSGDSICSGYWNQHEVTREAIQGSWMKTRDKYHVDADGYYWYEGRSNDMLKVGGIWVSPTEVEAAITEHPAVLECAVVAMQTEERLVQPKAYVVLRERSAACPSMESEIQLFVKERLAPYKYPRHVEFIDELPKTATGKIQRYKLRQVFV
jgi:benzoate-CoA ligase